MVPVAEESVGVVLDVEGINLSHAHTVLEFLGLQSASKDAFAADGEPKRSGKWTGLGQGPAASAAAGANEEVANKYSYLLALDHPGCTNAVALDGLVRFAGQRSRGIIAKRKYS